MMGGLPREGCFASIPGKPHHGKSVMIDHWINGILEHNPNTHVFLHSVDDSKFLRIPRILGSKYKVPSELFRKAGYYITGEGKHLYPDFGDLYQQATCWLLEMIESERLIVADTSDLSNDLLAFKSWIRSMKQRFGSDSIVAFGDNFHLYDITTGESGENKTRAMSKMASNIPVELGVTCLFTMEIPKESLKPGIRPTYLNLKNSGGLSFDSKLNISVYQELQDFSDSGLIWYDDHYKETTVDNFGVTTQSLVKMPIIEAIVDKNKVSGKKKTIFYRIEPLSGHMTECTEKEHAEYKAKVEMLKAAKKTNGYS
jgi:hypothetical protein